MGKRISGKLFVGGLIIIAGVLALLFNIGVLPIEWKSIVLSWQMLLIAIGVGHFINRHYIGGVIWITIGITFLLAPLSNLMGFNYPMIHQLIWPISLILIGSLLIISHSKRHHPYRHAFWKEHDRHSSCNLSDDGKIDYNVIMSGIEEIFLKPVFRGGEINNIMGGVELDLRRTSLPEGQTVLKMDAICGGITLYIPQDWNVEIKTSATLGGFSDKRLTNGIDETHKLIIIASFIMGGGEIKC